MEIKCPLCTAEQSPSELTVRCLERSDEGELRLKKNCDYYYQVQAQIHVCSVAYSDFLVWSPHGVHIERIYPDSDLFSSALKEIETFYVYCVLPEIVGKWYTRQSTIMMTSMSPAQDSADEDPHTDGQDASGSSQELWVLL